LSSNSDQSPKPLSGRGTSAAEPPQRKRRWYTQVDSEVYGPYDEIEIARMAKQSQILRDDQVCAEGGSTWIEAANDPILNPLFRKLSNVTLDSAPPIRSKKRRSWTGTIVSALTLLIVIWVAWPYYAVFALMQAVHDGDVSALEKRVDWNSLRQALRGDLNARLLQNLSGKAKTNDSSGAMATGFAAMLGPAVINQMIDGYVTPQAVETLSRNDGSAGSANVDESASNFGKSFRQIRRVQWDQVKYAFFSGGPLTFRLDILPPNDPPLHNPVSLEFNWGGDWKLTRLLLPPDAFDPTSASAAVIKNSSSVSNPKPNSTKASTSSERPPIELTLLSKRFREADYKASSDFQAAILFELAIKNQTDKPIRAFDGVVTFSDLLDNEVLSSKLAINDLIGAGSTVNWNGSIKYNQFMDSHQRFRNEAQANLKVDFSVGKVLYADNSSLTASRVTTQTLSQQELDAMRARLASLWNVQPGVEHPEELYVTIRIRLNRDRRLAGPPQVVSIGSSPRYQAAANAAVQAVLLGQPYTMLKDETYEQWKYLDIDFDPRTMFRESSAKQ